MAILDVLFPRRCLSCGRIGKYFCIVCRQQIRRIQLNEYICPVCGRLALDGMTHPGCKTRYTPDKYICFFRYDGIVQKAVKALKYRCITDLAEEFVSLLPEVGGAYDVLIPIPLHPQRFKERGFNQVEVLGGIIARKLRIPMDTDILRRIKQTKPQVTMKDRKERLENMDHVFEIAKETKQSYGSVILFDDVFTTGATMRSATNVVKRNGTRFVCAITMSR